MTVAGDGAGSGHVATAAGVQPALACDLAGTAAPTGTCAASYPEGTAVGLTVTPGTNSSFDGWAADALTSSSAFLGPIPPGGTRVDQSLADYLGTEATADFRVADVQFGSGDANLGAVEIVSSDWRVDPESAAEGFIPWTVEVRNTSSSQLESVRIEFSTYDAAGKILGASFTFLGPIAPGAAQSANDVADYHGTEASAKFQVSSVE